MHIRDRRGNATPVVSLSNHGNAECTAVLRQAQDEGVIGT